MSILPAELQLYKSATITDTTANGGRITGPLVVSGVLANCFDYVLPEELSAGSTKFRKLGYKVSNDDDLILYSSKVFLDAPTPGQDWVTMFAGSQRDTMADHGGAQRIYGVAFLQSNVAAGAETVILQVEHSSITGIFQDGDGIIITDKATALSTSGNREIRTISGVPSVSGVQVTIHLDAPLANGYTTTNNARVSSILSGGNLACSVSIGLG